MLTLIATVDFLADGEYHESDLVDVFGNFDVFGNVSGGPCWGETAWAKDVWGGAGVDDTQPLNQSPIPLFPNASPPPSWGESLWGGEAWGSSVPRTTHSWGETNWLECGWCDVADRASVSFETPTLHFGRIALGVKSRDSAGNRQSANLQTTERTVNSTPLPASRLKRGSWFGREQGDNFQTFTYTESPQLVQATDSS